MQNIVFLKTVGGHVLFCQAADQNTDAMEIMVQAARRLQGIPGDQDPAASLSDSGLCEFAVGTEALPMLLQSCRLQS